jgi:hypothetical protein
MDGRLPQDASIDGVRGILNLSGAPGGAPEERAAYKAAGSASSPTPSSPAGRAAGKNVSAAGGFSERYAALITLSERINAFTREVETHIAKIGQQPGRGGAGGMDMEDFGMSRRRGGMGDHSREGGAGGGWGMRGSRKG